MLVGSNAAVTVGTVEDCFFEFLVLIPTPAPVLEDADEAAEEVHDLSTARHPHLHRNDHVLALGTLDRLLCVVVRNLRLRHGGELWSKRKLKP